MNFEQREKAKRAGEINDHRIWVVEFESMNYCGAPSHCLVWALDEDDAKDAASEFAADYYREQDEDQWREEYAEDMDEDEVIWATVTSAVLLEGSEFAKYVEDEAQQQAYYQFAN